MCYKFLQQFYQLNFNKVVKIKNFCMLLFPQSFHLQKKSKGQKLDNCYGVEPIIRMKKKGR